MDQSLISEFDRIDNEIKKRWCTVREVAELALQIRDKGLWRARFSSWDTYCRERFGKTADAFRKFEVRRDARKMLSETTGETVRTASGGNTQGKDKSKEVINVSAKVDPTEPVHYPKPQPAPPSPEPATVKPELVPVLRELRMEIDGLLGLAAFARNERLIRCREKLRILLAEGEPDLFGEPAGKEGRFVAPSLEVMKLYARRQGWSEQEAERCWHHYNAKGWKVGSSPMKNWHSAIALWMNRSYERGQTGTFNSNGRPSGPEASGPDYSKGF